MPASTLESVPESSFQRRVAEFTTRVDKVNDTVATNETPVIVPWPGRRREPEVPDETPSTSHTVCESVPSTPIEQARKFETLGRMLAGVVHDLNNIFAVIGGHAELLSIQTAGSNPSVEVIHSSVGHASAMTHRLLSYVRPVAESPTALDLSAIVSELRPLIRAVAGSNVECLILADDPTEAIRAHRDRIEQIIFNLVANSRDALPNGGVVGIRAATIDVRTGRPGWPANRPLGRYATLTVADNGTGIDEPTRARIFEPFFTTKGTAGTGLGLATVREIVDLYRGHIEVESDPNFGTTFRILLPVEPVPTESDIHTPAELAAIYDGYTALLVDDDDAVRSLAKAALESIGFNVIEAQTGDAALRLARVVQEPIDLLVTDYVMPGLGGRKLAERMRFARPGLPIVFVSGYAPLAHETEPGTTFVAKPFSQDRFLAGIHRVAQQVVTG